jgi:hypothetical protein
MGPFDQDHIKIKTKFLLTEKKEFVMNKIRQYLVALSLLVTLAGVGVPVVGTVLAASTHQTVVASYVKPATVCPGGGRFDC